MDEVLITSYNQNNCFLLLFNLFAMTSNQENWIRSDRYHNSFLIPEDQNLNAALKNSDDNGLPAIAITAAQGKFLNLIAKSIHAKRILEVGTLGGYVVILCLTIL